MTTLPGLPPLMLVETHRRVDTTHLTEEESQGLHFQIDAKFSLAEITVELTLGRDCDAFEASIIFYCSFCGDDSRTYLGSSEACRECRTDGIHGVWHFDLCYPREKASSEKEFSHDFSGAPFPEDWRNSPMVDRTFVELLRSVGLDGLTATLAGAHYNTLCVDYLERTFTLAKQCFSSAEEFYTAWDGTAALSEPGEVKAAPLPAMGPQ